MDLLACRLAVALDEQDAVRVECRVDGSHRSARCLHDGNGFVLSEVEESGRVASGNNKQVSFVAAQSDGIDERESQVVEDDWDAGTASWCRYASQVLTERARKLRGVLHQATVRSAGTLGDQVSSRERRSRHVEQQVASPDSQPSYGVDACGPVPAPCLPSCTCEVLAHTSQSCAEVSLGAAGV